MSGASVQSEKQWNSALEVSARMGCVSLTSDQWDVWDACYGDVLGERVTGLNDHLLEVAFLRAIDLAGDTP